MPVNMLHFFIQACLNALSGWLHHCTCSPHAQVFPAIYPRAMGIVTFFMWKYSLE